MAFARGRAVAKALINPSNAFTTRLVQIRNLLSPAYCCDAEWKERLTSPALSKVNADYLISQLFVQFEKNAAATAVDMEVFSNKIQDVHPTQLNVVETLLNKFRRSVQACSMIDSMSHAVVRAYIELNQSKRLINIIQKKKDFGVFPDAFAFSLLLDDCIKSNDLPNAVKVAYEMMLQEDFSHIISRLLALHACSQYLYKEKDTLLAPVTQDGKPVLDTGEEQYKVVKFLPVFTYDDHFDIVNEKVLLGKTLELIGIGQTDHPVYYSSRLLGLALHEKFTTLLNELEQWLKEPHSLAFHRDVLEMISASLHASRFKTENIVRESGFELREDKEYNFRITEEEKKNYIEKFQSLLPRLISNPRLLDVSFLSDAEQFVKKEVEKHSENDMQLYKKQINAWNTQRMENVMLQGRAFRLKEKQETLDQKMKELTEKEELLNYFVRQNDISLGLLRAAKPKQDVGVVDMEEYVDEPGKRSKKGKTAA